MLTLQHACEHLCFVENSKIVGIRKNCEDITVTTALLYFMSALQWVASASVVSTINTRCLAVLTLPLWA